MLLSMSRRSQSERPMSSFLTLWGTVPTGAFLGLLSNEARHEIEAKLSCQDVGRNGCPVVHNRALERPTPTS